MIYVAVDRLTKIRHLISCYSTIDAPEFIKPFIQYVFKLLVYQDIVMSDTGYWFVANYKGTVFKQLQTEQRLLTAYHLQTDEQTKRINAVVKQYLHRFVNHL